MKGVKGTNVTLWLFVAVDDKIAQQITSTLLETNLIRNTHTNEED